MYLCIFFKISSKSWMCEIFQTFLNLNGGKGLNEFMYGNTTDVFMKLGSDKEVVFNYKCNWFSVRSAQGCIQHGTEASLTCLLLQTSSNQISNKVYPSDKNILHGVLLSSWTLDKYLIVYFYR